MFWKKIVNIKELLESMKYIITLSTKEQWKQSIKFSKFLYLCKRSIKRKCNLEEVISDFLIYMNDREDMTTKVAPFRAIMNYENKEFIYKI